ncbi:MAG: hypothetical protein CFE21_10130 [Bacteroidetes bacterium B1(2017)]|nr:MAG: hypothetical protein CFE21_10130 [Bacteroidetes bacterium B1(2017)]
MRKIILLLALLAQITCYGQAPNEILFRVHYNPEKTYNRVAVQDSKIIMRYKGSNEILKVLKEQGLENPTIKEKTSSTETILKTGKLIDSSSFPLVMEMVKIETNEKSSIDLNGMLIYGRGYFTRPITFDSIHSASLTEKDKDFLLPVLQKLFSQLNFPEKTLKIGDTMMVESPISIPVASMNIEMNITTVYKLISIKNGKANFDVSQFYTMKSVIKKYPMEGTGSGKGSLVYDINENYYISLNVDSEMKLNLQMESVGLELTSKSRLSQKSQIAKN